MVRNKMKRSVAFMTAAALVLGLCGCHERVIAANDERGAVMSATSAH